MHSNRKVAIIGGARIPFTKSYTHYSKITNNALMTAALQALVRKYHLQGKLIDDVVLGTLLHYPSDWDYAREIVLDSGLSADTPALFIARACGTSLDAANVVGMKISTGQIEVGIAGGCDSNSDVPITLMRRMAHKLIRLNKAKTFKEKLRAVASLRPADFAPHPPNINEPRTGLSMGGHTEYTVKKWKISREEQDQQALLSHQNSAKAYDSGFYSDLVFPFSGIERDTILRPDSSMEQLAKLQPAFDFSGAGTLTAGNSSAYTDGASCILLSSEDYARKNNLEIQSYLADVQVGGVDFVTEKANLLLAPVRAVPKLLARNGLKLQDFDFYEIHEAFAGQVLATLKAWEDEDYCKNVLGLPGALGSIDRTRLNTRGSSVAAGHPFAATGSKVLANASKILALNGGGRCLISVCTAGGMGVTAIVER